MTLTEESSNAKPTMKTRRPPKKRSWGVLGLGLRVCWARGAWFRPKSRTGSQPGLKVGKACRPFSQTHIPNSWRRGFSKKKFRRLPAPKFAMPKILRTSPQNPESSSLAKKSARSSQTPEALKNTAEGPCSFRTNRTGLTNSSERVSMRMRGLRRGGAWRVLRRLLRFEGGLF